MKRYIIVICAILAGVCSLSAQAQQSSRDAGVYGNNGALVQGAAQEGIVVQVRHVRIEASQTATYAGRGAGAAIGGALGSRLGKSTASNIAGGVLGGLFGGIIGDVASDKLASSSGTEIVVVLKNGQAVVVTQAGESPFAEGSPVYLIQSGGTVRIVARAASLDTRPSSSPQSYGAPAGGYPRRSM